MSDSDWSRKLPDHPLQYPFLWILSHITALLSNHALYAYKWTSCHVGSLIEIPLIQKYLGFPSHFSSRNFTDFAPPFLPQSFSPPIISYHSLPLEDLTSVYRTLTGPPNMIISHVCHIRPDHFLVGHSSVPFRLRTLVQDYTWSGALMVVRYVAENSKEVVVECAGWNVAGDQIIRFLVVDKLQVKRTDMALVSLGSLMIYQRLPAALPFGMYNPRWYRGNDLPLPYPPTLPLLPIVSPPSLSSAHVSLFIPDSVPDSHMSLWSILCMV
jgi:hypothetical protein